MKSEVFNPSLCIVLKTAHLYYIEKKSQKEVAEELNISNATVSRLLKRAEAEGIISIEIRSPYCECIQLEKSLCAHFGLKEVIVVPATRLKGQVAESSEEEETKKMVALEAARYVQRVLSHDDLLGIAWGGTMYYVIQYLNPCQKVGASFVTLHGSLSCCDYNLDVNTLVQRMAMAFGGKHYSIASEGLMDTSEQVRMLTSQKRVSQIFESFKNVTISVSGTGSLYPNADSPLSRLAYLKAEELAELREKGAYGDLMLRFFDANGEECPTDLKERTLAIDLDVYRSIPTKMIAASGAKKAHTLLALLKGRLVDVLVIDDKLALAVSRLGGL
ncbi:MAG: helix-turn-helix domain-containing protein [Chloroflexi bacterium]|nr:sugar-binding domain-containing protein [Anaerolineaceae bacterium]NMB89438.1 helix-turn-helix domain-containing protein [Chloroflexota bacterium]